MAVFRVERTQGYTVMSNYHLRDKSLSLKAKGLAFILMHIFSSLHAAVREARTGPCTPSCYGRPPVSLSGLDGG